MSTTDEIALREICARIPRQMPPRRPQRAPGSTG